MGGMSAGVGKVTSLERFRCCAAVACLTLPLCIPALPAFGQVIDEITVTARKREESLQEVPLSISALSSEQLRDRGIANNYDLAYFTPNFNTVQQTGRRLDRPVIRGMAAPATRGEPNASYFIDGVYVSHRSSISTATLEAVKRTEVIRGPQSSQFGRATFAGAVNYVTRKPNDNFSGELNTRAGANDNYKIGGWFSGPILQERLLYLVAVNWERYGGQWHNALVEDSAYPAAGFFIDPPQQGDNSRLGNEETQDVMARLTWLPFDGAEVNLKYSFADADDGHFPSLITTELNCWLPPDDLPATPQVGEPVWWRTTEGAFCGEFDASDRENRVNLPDFREGVQAIPPPGESLADFFAAPAEPGTRRQTERFLAEWVQDLGDWQLTARGSASEDDFEQGFDLDHQQVRALFGLFSFFQQTTMRDWSAELRIASPLHKNLRVQLGAYYYDWQFKTRQRSFPGIASVGATGVPPTFANWEWEFLENLALFGQLDWDLSEQLTLSVEARWAEDEKSLIPANSACSTINAKFDNFTPRLILRWQPQDNLNFYLLTAKGNKPGGFNDEYFRPDVACSTQDEAVASRNALVEEEEQWTYEFGIKSNWLDKRLTANFAVFYIDWTNQGTFATITIPLELGGEVVTTAISNKGKSEVSGFELETNLVATEHLSLFASYGFTAGEFIEGIDEFLLESTGNGDLAGKEIASTPKHQLALGAVVRKPLHEDRELFFRTDYIYESDRWSQSANFGQISERTLVNLRLGMEADRWSIGGFVTNLLNDDAPLATLNFVNFDDGLAGLSGVTLANGNVANMWSLNPQRGREWGVELSYRFGD